MLFVRQEWIQWSVTENLGYDLFKQMITICPVKYNVLCFEDAFIQAFDCLSNGVDVGEVHLRVEFGDKFLLNSFPPGPETCHRLALVPSVVPGRVADP